MQFSTLPILALFAMGALAAPAANTNVVEDAVEARSLEPRVNCGQILPACFGGRNYRVSDRIVVEVDGTRWAIDGGPDGGSCTVAKSRADLVTTHGPFSSLLYGGVLPSALVAGGRMQARDAAALGRADIFFTTSLAPHCQSNY